MDESKDYEVGYGKPPRDTQFKKGTSGNPNGRPKKVKNIATDIKEELEEMVQITEGGQTKTVTKQRALIKSLLAKASQGNVRAAQTLLNLKTDVDQADTAESAEEWFTEDDLEIITQIQARMQNTQNPSKQGEDQSISVQKNTTYYYVMI